MDHRSSMGNVAFLLFLVHLGCAGLARGKEDFSAGCFEVGLNPHPTHRCRYLVCKEVAPGKLIPHQYSCPEYEVYSHFEQSCVPEDKIEPCDREGAMVEGDPECNSRELNCKDCSTLVICAKEPNNVFKVIGNYSCVDPKKYCDNNIQDCTDLQPIQCVPHAGCTGVGTFPSINNCSIYYNCKAQGDVLTDDVGVCDKGSVFDPSAAADKKPCKHRDRPEDCITVKCSGVLEKKEYHKDSSYYVVCTPDGQGYVFYCGANVKYSPTYKMCEDKIPTSSSPSSSTSTTTKTT